MMLLHAAVVFIVVVHRAVAASSNCSICAEGQTIGLPNKTVTVANYPALTCSAIQGYAENGFVLPEDCSKLPSLATQCGCTGGTASAPTVASSTNTTTTTAPQAPTQTPIAPTDKPVAAPTDQPVAPTKKPFAPTEKPIAPITQPVASPSSSSETTITNSSSCSICPSGEHLMNPDYLVSTENLGFMTCSQVQAQAVSVGSTTFCIQLPLLAAQCKCTNSNSNTTVAAPTVTPIASSPPSSPTTMSTNSSNCTICPSGQSIENPDVVVVFPNMGSLSCSELQSRAVAVGSASICSKLPHFAHDCGCLGGSSSPVAVSNTTASVAPSPSPFSKPVGPTVAPVTAPSSSPSTSTKNTTTTCSICAAGQTMELPNKSVTIAGFPTFTCSQIQGFADSGAVASQGKCSQLPPLATECGCTGGAKTPAPVASPTKAPVAPTTSAPVAGAAAAPTAAPSACSICSAGQTLGNPNASVTSNGQTLTCGQIQSYAEQGVIPHDKCTELPMLATTCGCTGGTAAASTLAPIAPSTSPVAAPVAAAAPATPICSICAAGQTLANPNVMVDTGSNGKLSCATIEGYAGQNLMTADQCAQLPKLATTCGCTGGTTGTAPTPSTTAPAPTAPAPTAPAPTAPAAPAAPTCSICGAGKVIVHGTASVKSAQGTFTCSQIEGFADQGQIPANMCSGLSKLASTCGCQAAAPTAPIAAAPVASEAPTITATYPPTQEVTYYDKSVTSAAAPTATRVSRFMSMVMALTISNVMFIIVA